MMVGELGKKSSRVIILKNASSIVLRLVSSLRYFSSASAKVDATRRNISMTVSDTWPLESLAWYLRLSTTLALSVSCSRMGASSLDTSDIWVRKDTGDKSLIIGAP